ncbi:MAG: SGNH/GDSL hydrolase family protein [Clostridia bacterium]|jgi:acyl-CoA thioesterase-1|nr:SGNH/GDSL hydrolase family protein [Clostridia bacterium]
MKILFFGDSITDASRDRTEQDANTRLGGGYVLQIAGRLWERSAVEHDIVNRGISGNRVVDLYARVKADVWNERPDVLSILVGVNSLWHELFYRNGVELPRWERVYRMLIEDTQKALPQTKIMLCEPFIEHGEVTDKDYAAFSRIADYAAVARKLAQEYGLCFVPLQAAVSDAAKQYGAAAILRDGVHPTGAGSVVIAREWLRAFDLSINK